MLGAGSQPESFRQASHSAPGYVSQVWWFEREWSHRFIYLMFGSKLVEALGRFRKCGLVGGDMSLGVGFEVSKVHARPSLMVCFPTLYLCNLRIRWEL